MNPRSQSVKLNSLHPPFKRVAKDLNPFSSDIYEDGYRLSRRADHPSCSIRFDLQHRASDD